MSGLKDQTYLGKVSRCWERSLLISAQEKTQSIVKGQENPGQTSGGRLYVSRSHRTRRVGLEGLLLDVKKQQHNAPSSSRHNKSQRPSTPASGDRLQSTLKEDDVMRHVLSPGAKLIPNLSTRVKENHKKKSVNEI